MMQEWWKNGQIVVKESWESEELARIALSVADPIPSSFTTNTDKKLKSHGQPNLCVVCSIDSKLHLDLKSATLHDQTF